MTGAFLIIVMTAVILTWLLATHRSLAAMEENINSAMNQIGICFSSRFEAITALLDLAQSYAECEAKALAQTVKSRRIVITPQSAPNEVRKQERVIFETLEGISMIAEKYPQLKADKRYAKCMDAVDSYEKMVDTSRLIYNDSVAKLKRAICRFPASLAAGMFGFGQRDYLETLEEKECP